MRLPWLSEDPLGDALLLHFFEKEAASGAEWRWVGCKLGREGAILLKQAQHPFLPPRINLSLTIAVQST